MITPDTFLNIDCRDGFEMIEPETVDCIVTDPPYVEKLFIPAYSALAEGAARILKPGGIVAMYCGIYFIPRVLAIFEAAPDLRYWWTIAQVHSLGQPKPMMWHKKAVNCWKPIIIYSKDKANPPQFYHFDVISSRSEKNYHQWQQAISEAIALIRRFSAPGETICDPFCGSGTTPLAAKLTGRRYIAFEIEKDTFHKAMLRLDQTPLNLSRYGAPEPEICQNIEFWQHEDDMKRGR